MKMRQGSVRLFNLGQTVATPGAIDAMLEAAASPVGYLDRHASGDWGELEMEDRRENELAVNMGERILSAYMLGTGVKIWVITEADRSVTTILLPDEY